MGFFLSVKNLMSLSSSSLVMLTFKINLKLLSKFNVTIDMSSTIKLYSTFFIIKALKFGNLVPTCLSKMAKLNVPFVLLIIFFIPFFFNALSHLNFGSKLFSLLLTPVTFFKQLPFPLKLPLNFSLDVFPLTLTYVFLGACATQICPHHST